MRRLDRPRRLPARLGKRLPDDDPARGLGRPRLHPRARRAPARDRAREGARLHRFEGRSVRQHPGDPGDRGQDRRPADRAVRLARGRARARGRALARPLEVDPRARRAGAGREGARDDAPRPRAGLRSRRARALAAGPLDAEGDLSEVRVPESAEPRRRARCRRPCRGAAEADRRHRPVARGA